MTHLTIVLNYKCILDMSEEKISKADSRVDDTDSLVERLRAQSSEHVSSVNTLRSSESKLKSNDNFLVLIRFSDQFSSCSCRGPLLLIILDWLLFAEKIVECIRLLESAKSIAQGILKSSSTVDIHIWLIEMNNTLHSSILYEYLICDIIFQYHSCRIIDKSMILYEWYWNIMRIVYFSIDI